MLRAPTHTNASKACSCHGRAIDAGAAELMASAGRTRRDFLLKHHGGVHKCAAEAPKEFSMIESVP